MGRFVTDVSKECSFETWINTHPKTFVSRPKRPRVPVTLLRENHVTCNINLQVYVAMCGMAITLLVLLLRYVVALSVSLPSFLSIFYISRQLKRNSRLSSTF